MKEIIVAGILFLTSAILFVLSIRSFREKGFLFNNAWIFASEDERRSLDKKPYYRQSAVVFLLTGVIFLLNGAAVLTGYDFIYIPVIAVAAVLVVYVIVSTVKTEKNK